MSRSLRIAIADDEPDMRDFLADVLPDLGHRVVAVAATGAELVDQARIAAPDLIISDIKMPDMDGLEAVAAINTAAPIPAILISAHHEPELIARAGEQQVLAYLVKPIRQPHLEAAIAIAMSRHEEIQVLRQEAADLRQALEDRKVIERAKGLLMKKLGLSEPDAFRRLQKAASIKNLKLAEMARAIITAEAALDSIR